MKISLNNKFYNKEAIEEALKDFKEVCGGRVLNANFDVELLSKEEVANLKEEFGNYVIGLMKNKTLV